MNTPLKAPFLAQGKRAELALVITALFWSTGGLFIKLVNAPALLIAGARSLLAIPIMLAFNWKPRFTWSFAQIGAGISYALTMISFVFANKLTSSANAILLQYSAPVYIAVFGGLLLGEKVRSRDLFALLAIVAGTILFFAEKLDAGNALGNGIAVFSGLAFAFTFIFSRMQKDESPAESFIIAHAICFLVSLPSWQGYQPSFQDVAGLSGLGILQIGLSSVLFTKAIRYVPALASIFIVTLEPVLNPVWVFLVQGEIPSLLSLLGGLIILGTVLCIQILDQLKPKIPEVS